MPRPKKQVLKQRKDGRYCCTYKGKQFMGATSDEALALREAYKHQLEQGRGKVETLGQYATSWLPIAFPAVRKSTYRGLAVHMQKLVDELGDSLISEITPTMIRAVYSTRYLGMSDSYIKSGRQLFCSLFDAAVADGYCRSNPARDKNAKPHRGKEVKHHVLTDQEREWIETLCTDHRMHAVAMTMLYAGLRPPEAKALNIGRDVDFENETITLTEFAHLGERWTYEYTESGKNKWAGRKIPLFPPLKEALTGKDGLLVSSAHGKLVTPTTWRVAWRSYITAMETAINGMPKRWYGRTKEHKKMLAEKEPLPAWIDFDVTPYDLRHAFCRWCRDNGVELKTCASWMGHSDYQMILKVYDEVTDNRSNAEFDRLKTSVFHMQDDMQTESDKSEAVESKGVEDRTA